LRNRWEEVDVTEKNWGKREKTMITERRDIQNSTQWEVEDLNWQETVREVWSCLLSICMYNL
jgi:hypothetical protein